MKTFVCAILAAVAQAVQIDYDYNTQNFAQQQAAHSGYHLSDVLDKISSVFAETVETTRLFSDEAEAEMNQYS